MKFIRYKKDEQKNRKLRGDSRGMTLLELIIAVAIFSIAAVSLLQAFVTSGRINQKSNLYLEATTTAQNVMEEIKAKSFTDLAAAFNYPLDTNSNCRFSFLESQKAQINKSSGDSLTIQEVIKNTSSDGKVSYSPVVKYSAGMDESSVTASVISTNNGDSYTLNPRTKGTNASKYYFKMTNVKCLNETFDVLVEFDGSSDTSYKKSSLSADDEKNDFEMPNIAKLDRNENGFLIQEKDWGLAAVKAWNQKYAEMYSEFSGKSDDDLIAEVLPSVKRTLTITITKEGGVVTAKGQEHFEYTTSKGDVLCSDHDNPDSDHSSGYNDNYIAFFSTKIGDTLEGLYIFYYPNYNSTSTVSPLDNIIFDNTTGEEISFYVIKQRDEESRTPTSAQERSYKMSLTVKEIPTQSNWNTNVGIYRAQTVLRTNLNYDISESTTGTSRTEVKNQMQLTYQAVTSTGASGVRVTGTTAGTVLNLNDLDDKETSDRIYTVKVSVYKEGAADKEFPEEDLVATLDGAKED